MTLIYMLRTQILYSTEQQQTANVWRGVKPGTETVGGGAGNDPQGTPELKELLVFL